MASLLLVSLSGCGQKGGLYLPSDPDFKQRATLPDIVRRQFPDWPADTPAAQKAKPASGATTPDTNVTAPTPAAAASAATSAPADTSPATPVTPSRDTSAPASDNTSTPATPAAR